VLAAQDKASLAQFFRDIQQSYSQLYFYAHFLLDTCQSLAKAQVLFGEQDEKAARAIEKLKGDVSYLKKKL